jgi:hypothetical protein
MITLENELQAEDILRRTRAETLARAELARPRHAPWMTLLALAAMLVATYLVRHTVPASDYTEIMLAILSAWLAFNTVDSWQDRRRLEAAITLLTLRDEAA